MKYTNSYQPPLDQKRNEIRKSPKVATGRLPQDVVSYYEKLVESGIAPYPLRIAKAILYRGMNNEQAETLFNIGRKTACATTEVFNSIMKHYWDTPDKVIEYFHILLEDGRSPNAITYDCLIRAYMRKGMEMKVKEALLELTRASSISGGGGKEGEEKVVMEQKTLASLLQYFARLQRVDDVLEIFQNHSNNVNLTEERSYSTMITALLTCGHAEQAWKLAQEGIQKGFTPNSAVWGHLIATMKPKNSQLALSIYDEMLKLGVKPTLPIYYQLIDIYSFKSRPDKVLEVYDTVLAEGLKPDSALLIKIFDTLTLQSPTSAHNFLKETRKYGSDAISQQHYKHLIGSLLRGKLISEAQMVISDIENGTIYTPLPSSPTSTSSASTSGLTLPPAEFAATLSDPLAYAYAAYNQDWPNALVVVDKMLSHNILPSPHTVEKIAEIMTNNGKSSQARQFVDHMVSKGVTVGNRVKTSLPLELS